MQQPNFDMFSEFLELDFIIFNQKKFKNAIFYLKMAILRYFNFVCLKTITITNILKVTSKSNFEMLNSNLLSDLVYLHEKGVESALLTVNHHFFVYFDF